MRLTCFGGDEDVRRDYALVAGTEQDAAGALHNRVRKDLYPAPAVPGADTSRMFTPPLTYLA